MKRLMLGLASAALLAAGASASAVDIDVMTQNQYVGTDLIGLVTEPDFNAAVVNALKTRAASLPSERIKALADLIYKRGPTLVGLEEVYKFTCVDDDPGDTRGCQNPEIAGAFTNQLADTLAGLGGKYVVAAKVYNMNLPATLPPPLNSLPGIPIGYDGRVIYVGVVDQDVILVRQGVVFQATDFAALNALNPMLCSRASQNGCNYVAAASADLNLPGVPVPVTIRFERGFVGVDAMVNGRPYRFVVTHLETRLETFGLQGRFYQAAQAAELDSTLQVLQAYNTIGKTLVVGDFNSDSRDAVIPVPAPAQYLGVPPYLQFADSGYTDIWTLRPGTANASGAPLIGFSCCQDADLGNHKSALYERIDLIFSLAKPTKVQDARLLGESISDKTMPMQPGLWPSDHASVAARLTFND
jgi:hypothetical protein